MRLYSVAAIGLVCAGWVFGWGQHADAESSGQQPPNLVVFIADDLGYYDTQPYGSRDAKTPNLRRLAEAGRKITGAYVASPACAPSRAALLTGLMPARSGAIINHSRPRAEIKKLPAYLQQLGYEVASFGKVAHYNHGPEYGFDLVQGEGFHKHEGIGQAVAFLESRDKSKPLCIFVGTNWPHVPWPEVADGDAREVTLPPTHVDTDKTRYWRKRYYAAVAQMDEDLGTILAAAREHLDPARTWFFFTSDHGAQWPFGKWNLYDAGTRVPLVVAGPGVKAGTSSDALVSWVDLLPTLVELAGGSPPADIDGRSFAAVLRGEKATHRDKVYTTHTGDGRMNVYPIRAVTDGRWKYILNTHPELQHATHINRAAAGDGLDYWRTWEAAARTDPAAAKIVERYRQRPREELYDLAADPYEQHNLAADPAHRERLATLRDKVAEWMKQQADDGAAIGEPLRLGEEPTPIPPANKKANPKTNKAR